MEIELQDVRRYSSNRALKEPLLEDIHIIEGEDDYEEEKSTVSSFSPSKVFGDFMNRTKSIGDGIRSLATTGSMPKKKDDIEKGTELNNRFSLTSGTVDEEKIKQEIKLEQRTRLSSIFDACDTGKKGYLTNDEVQALFHRMNAMFPDSEIMQRLTCGQQVTLPIFLYCFALAREEQRKKELIETDLSILERLGKHMLRNYSKSQAISGLRTRKSVRSLSTPNGRIVLMTKAEHRELNWTKFFYVIRAALIGAVAAAAASVFNWWCDQYYKYDGDLWVFVTEFTLIELYYWLVIIGSTIGFTIVEIAALYIDALITAAKVGYIIGLEVWLIGYISDVNHATAALVRAALELDHPNKMVLGIKPLRYANKLNAYARTLLWKAKRGLTTVVVGLLFKKILPRTIARVSVPFVSVPVAAVWNALVAWKMIKDICAVVMGNVAVVKAAELIIVPRWDELSKDAQTLLYCVCGNGIAVEQSFKPSFETLLLFLIGHYGKPDPNVPLDDKFYFENTLTELPREEQLLILQIYALALFSYSNVALASIEYLKHLTSACYLNADERGLDELRRALHYGPSIDIEQITGLFRDSLSVDKSRSRWARFVTIVKVFVYYFVY